MKVLVTGASGFIGRRVWAHLAALGADVLGADLRPPPGGAHGAGFQPIDLLASGPARALIERERPTHLVHLAWNAQPGRFWSAPDNLAWAAATLSLTQAFIEAGGRRAVYAGSCAEYGWDRAVLSESSPLAAATFYGRMKDVTRRGVEAAAALGLGAAWGRVFWLYGPAEAPGRLVSDVAAALSRGLTAECSEGRQARDFLHVDDVASAFVQALLSDWSGAFNIGSGRATPVREVVETLAAALGAAELVRFGARPSPPGDPPSLCADIRVLRDEIGFRPRFTLGEGLAETARWWRVQAGTG